MGTSWYEICGLVLQLEAEAPMALERSIFAVPEREPHHTISIRAVDEIPAPELEPVVQSRPRLMWRQDSRLIRESWDLFRPLPHCRLDCDLQDLRRMDCQIRQSYWPWATTEQYLWNGLQLPALLLHHRSLVFHASFIQTGGSGLLFTAPSGVGKSTQAALWQRYRGAEILNGDKAGIRLGQSVLVCGVPFSGTSGICRNASVPLKAMVVLQQGPDNHVERLTPTGAVRALCPNLFLEQSVPEEWQLGLSLLLELVARVPVLRLTCTPDLRAVEALEKALP